MYNYYQVLIQMLGAKVNTSIFFYIFVYYQPMFHSTDYHISHISCQIYIDSIMMRRQEAIGLFEASA